MCQTKGVKANAAHKARRDQVVGCGMSVSFLFGQECVFEKTDCGGHNSDNDQ
jgi:hypothetical protein